MNKFFLFLFTLFFNVHADILETGNVYNITWNDAIQGHVTINLEHYDSNNWIITQNNGYKYLSLVIDGYPNYYLWNVPEGLNNFWMYDLRILIKNLSDNTILRNLTFNIKNPPTISTNTTDTNHSSDDKEICILNWCIPIYALVLLIIAILIVLCICLKCCCC
ncbi:hypothetical protein CPAV1605_1246 [seawater metagenome]|uniref:Uncharacterized protein n=1 Tax=seawater metagenome TaxID=1561972 RepID=A0A5E8CLZ5_9ZZZZ